MSGRALASGCLLAAAGGSMDAWVYIGHGHVFANAQTGNMVLGGLALATGDLRTALAHLPPLAAFAVGVIASQSAAVALKRRHANSRTVRLTAEGAALAVLALAAPRLSQPAVTAAIGFLAAVHTTALSSIHGWSFNTGFATGTMKSALSAATRAWLDRPDPDARAQATLLGAMTLAFLVGSVAGALVTYRLGDPALLLTAAATAAAAVLAHAPPEPIG